MKKTLFSILALFLFVTQAKAQLASADAPFENWMTLSTALRAQGIDPASVNWLAIEPMCLGLKSSQPNEIAYNKCKFEKAWNARKYTADSNACDNIAKSDVPNAARLDRPVIRRTIIDSSGIEKVIEDTSPGLRNSEIRALRRSSYLKCMRDSGWTDPDDWRAGRNGEFPVIR